MTYLRFYLQECNDEDGTVYVHSLSGAYCMLFLMYLYTFSGKKKPYLFIAIASFTCFNSVCSHNDKSQKKTFHPHIIEVCKHLGAFGIIACLNVGGVDSDHEKGSAYYLCLATCFYPPIQVRMLFLNSNI